MTVHRHTNHLTPFGLNLSKPCLIAFSLAATPAIAAQPATPPYPAKPIRLIVPQPPSGTVDMLARLIGGKLTAALGQQVVIDNRAGGGTLIGSEMVAKGAPDGYTLLLTANPHTTNPALHAKLPYDTVRDFAGITQIAASPLVLTAHPSLPARTVPEVITLAKQRPGQLSYGTSGNGGPQHLAGEMFKFMAGVSMIHVPYRGGAPAIADLLAGQTQLMFGSTFTVIPQHAAGKLRALGVTSATPWPTLPGVMPVAQTLPQFEVRSWLGLAAPAGLPAPIAQRLNAEVKTLLQRPDVMQTLTLAGSAASYSSSQSMQDMVQNDIARWRSVIARRNIQLEN